MVTTPTFWGSEVIFSSAANAGASRVTGLQDGSFAIVWGDSLGDIHGRRFDALGSFNSTDFLFYMSQATTQPLRLPELVQNGDGTTGVYFNLTASAADGDIYINAPDFDTVGGRTGKATVADRPYDEFMRDVAATEFNNTAATAVLINTPRAGTSGVSDLYLAYTTTGGLIHGSPQIVSIGAGETVVDASVAGLPNGNTLVTYHTAKVSTGEHFVRYRVYDDYTDLTGQREASSTPGNDSFPAATALANSSDGFVIVTQDALGLRFLYNGYGQAFTKSVPGTLSSGGGSFAKAIAPEVTALKDGGFIVAWTDTTEREGDNSPALKIGLQRFDKNGNAVGDNVFINAPGDQSLESITTLDDGRVVVTYNTETGDSTGVTRLAYRILDPREATLYGSARADTIVSREDGAHLIAGAGEDTLLGRAGADTLDGESGADTMRGTGGNDLYYVDTAGDRVFEASGQGSDRVAASVDWALAAGQQVERLQTTNSAGTGGIDLTGNEVAQQLIGNAGANALNGKGGADSLYGLAGNDLYYVDTAGDRVFETAGQGSDRVAANVSYTLASGQSVEAMLSSSSAGTTAINLTGNELAQAIKGNAGANVLNGKAGADSLTGLGGADTFAFDTGLGAGNIDRISDFSAAADTIRLDKTVFSALNLGTLSAASYKDIGDPGARVDANDRIIYNDDTGALFYDANGSAAGGRVHFATLDTEPATLTNADFVVVA